MAVADAQLLAEDCASRTLYQYTILVGSFCAGATYVVAVCHAIVVPHVLLVYHCCVNVVHHGSLGFVVNVTVEHSFALLLTAFAVGATLFHVNVAVAQLPHAVQSLAL